ncbi:hypothetical protein [Salmonella enterica]|uniref:hypothetical protein n=1 Tax=Salmonella enterica TaxID=28901 RepID=UPI0016541DF6|nr:hypothetical protein [Salmonella enterica]MBC7018315.1 hypothetical protein [Salmonella enterica subsp. enterica serovar Enteritidis]
MTLSAMIRIGRAKLVPDELRTRAAASFAEDRTRLPCTEIALDPETPAHDIDTSEDEPFVRHPQIAKAECWS